MWKDVEWTFRFLKGKWRILEVGIQVYGAVTLFLRLAVPCTTSCLEWTVLMTNGRSINLVYGRGNWDTLRKMARLHDRHFLCIGFGLDCHFITTCVRYGSKQRCLGTPTQSLSLLDFSLELASAHPWDFFKEIGSSACMSA